MRHRPFFAAAIIIVLSSAAMARAHDSPEHVIENLTLIMSKKGPSAELLYRRACEYRTLRRYEKATADLNSALKLDKQYVPAFLELGRVQLAQQQTDDAWRTTESVRLLTKDANTLGRLALLRSDIQYSRSEMSAALAECAEACRLVPGDVEYLLRRSQLQAELGKHEARLKDLQSACEANPSVVLSIELIEARIDSGQAESALAQIEQELAESRWRSSWLIRRARAKRELGDLPAARLDLEAAIAEINTRLNPERPDITLLVDRGLAFAMLGDTRAAQADLAAASAAKVGRALLYRLMKELPAASPAKPTTSSISTPAGDN